MLGREGGAEVGEGIGDARGSMSLTDLLRAKALASAPDCKREKEEGDSVRRRNIRPKGEVISRSNLEDGGSGSVRAVVKDEEGGLPSGGARSV